MSIHPVTRPDPAWEPDVRPPRCGCVGLRWHEHHDRLLRVESDPDELLDLLELAVTWTELDYSDADVVPPQHWTGFALAHHWHHPERMERLFGLAADVALRPAGGPTRSPRDLLRMAVN